MNVYIIDRIDRYSWDDNYKAVIIAKDTSQAEKLARVNIIGFKEAKLKVTEVDLSEEQIISVENMGA